MAKITVTTQPWIEGPLDSRRCIEETLLGSLIKTFLVHTTWWIATAQWSSTHFPWEQHTNTVPELLQSPLSNTLHHTTGNCHTRSTHCPSAPTDRRACSTTCKEKQGHTCAWKMNIYKVKVRRAGIGKGRTVLGSELNSLHSRMGLEERYELDAVYSGGPGIESSKVSHI